jgi:Cu-Zn family superoxide dismutase
MKHKAPVALLSALLLGASPVLALAAQVTAPIALATPTGPGDAVGAVTFTDSPAGAVISIDLHGLPPGSHGFHVHQKGDCGPTIASHQGPEGVIVEPPVPAGAAGGHFDPAHTGMHMGPEGAGHMGDLPYLTVAPDGSDHETLTAPHWTDVTGLKGHALVIHAGGDNYSDEPKPLGGGGTRIACGVVQ